MTSKLSFEDFCLTDCGLYAEFLAKVGSKNTSFQDYLEEIAKTSNACIALGQALNKDGSFPKTLEYRAGLAATLHRYVTQVSGSGRTSYPIVCTGGDPIKTGKSEASIMKGLLVEKYSIPATDVVCEELSTTTMENAYYSATILSKTPEIRKPQEDSINVMFITSEFHTPRALYCFDATYVHMVNDCKINLFPLPALSGCPLVDTISDEDMGERLNQRVNEQSLRQRMKGENMFIREEVVPNLSKHIKKGEVIIPPLPEEYLQNSIKQISDLTEVVKRQMEAAAAAAAAAE